MICTAEDSKPTIKILYVHCSNSAIWRHDTPPSVHNDEWDALRDIKIDERLVTAWKIFSPGELSVKNMESDEARPVGKKGFTIALKWIGG